MMKKRLVAFGLAGVMLMGMSMNVFAAEVNNEWNTGTLTGSGKTSVTGTQAASYTITIPSTIDEENILSTGLGITGTGNLEPGKKVTVTIGSKSIKMLRQNTSGASETETVNNSYNLSLSIDGTNALVDDDLIVGTLNEGATDNKIGTLKAIAPTKDNLKAGTYKADITFTIAYQ